jgi:hypothetical protein
MRQRTEAIAHGVVRLWFFSIRSRAVAKAMDGNEKVVARILAEHGSDVLSTDFIF